jgi:phosphoribosylaminoimidazole-succinocarboxamide synthase
VSVAEGRPALERAFVRAGKVRDIYRLDGHRLVLVASDRLSAFDVVLPTLIPDKGKVLTGLSRYWFAATAAVVPNHLLGTDPASLPEPFASQADDFRGRIMICQEVDVLPVEAIVRGYLAGTGWKEYREHGSVCGISLPPGLREADRLPEPLFTPSTKETVGHDRNITHQELEALVGPEMAAQLRETALQLYRVAAAHAESVGLILADTKFEFGVDPTTGRLLLVDELLTPDSSRFWDGDAYRPGEAQASFDKQFVRDWLELQGWDKTPPAPELPEEVVAGTRRRYAEAFARLTGMPLDRYLSEDRVA